jgi:hypothetical protein
VQPVLERQTDPSSRGTGARYLVLASLPHLPRFDQTRQRPIGREVLTARLALLPEAEAEEIALATSLMIWLRHSASRSNEEVIQEYKRITGLARTDALRRIVTFRFGLRTLIAALRRRRLGHGAPQRKEPLGVGPWVDYVRRRYSDPDFGLQHVLPWLPRARQLLEGDDAIGLERLLFGLVWTELDRMTCVDRFGFGAALAYAFKWDLVDRWLSSDAPSATQQFDELAREALNEFERPFSPAA